jgi:hypothetical protein
MGALKNYVKQYLSLKRVEGRTRDQLNQILQHLDDVDIESGSVEYNAMIDRIDGVFEHARTLVEPQRDESAVNIFSDAGTAREPIAEPLIAPAETDKPIMRDDSVLVSKVGRATGGKGTVGAARSERLTRRRRPPSRMRPRDNLPKARPAERVSAQTAMQSAAPRQPNNLKPGCAHCLQVVAFSAALTAIASLASAVY